MPNKAFNLKPNKNRNQMKNLLSILAVMAIAVVSQAATVKWSIGGSATYVMNDYLGNPYANQRFT